MRIQSFILITSIILLLIFTGCSSEFFSSTEISMPYSNSEYSELGWSVEELVAHFKELGFTNITTEITGTFDESDVGIRWVAIEDTSSNSWFTEYKKFEKDELYYSHRKIHIEAYVLTPTLTIDNSPEFAELISLDDNSANYREAVSSFMQSHANEYIEFDGTITNWYDEFWYISGVTLTVSVENSEDLHFSWNTDKWDELGLSGEYDFNNYHLGLIKEGMSVHIIAKIELAEEKWDIKIDSMQIID